MNVQLVILGLYFWILAGMAQFLSISAIFGIGLLALPLLVYVLVRSDRSGKYD